MKHFLLLLLLLHLLFLLHHSLHLIFTIATFAEIALWSISLYTEKNIYSDVIYQHLIYQQNKERDEKITMKQENSVELYQQDRHIFPVRGMEEGGVKERKKGCPK